MGQDASSTPYFQGPRPKLDEVRVRRSQDYVAIRVGTNCFEVVHKTEHKEVRTVTVDPLNCDCGDAVYHNHICKHLIAALYADGDQDAVRAYIELEDVI